MTHLQAQYSSCKRFFTELLQVSVEPSMHHYMAELEMLQPLSPEQSLNHLPRIQKIYYAISHCLLTHPDCDVCDDPWRVREGFVVLIEGWRVSLPFHTPPQQSIPCTPGPGPWHGPAKPAARMLHHEANKRTTSSLKRQHK